MTSTNPSTAAPLSRPRLALVAVIVLAVAGAFAAVGGWLSPRALTPARFIDTFERVNGAHPGFRRNHAKGVIVSGRFESNGDGTRLSKAAVFRRGRTLVDGRFALAGGMPYAADAVASVRSMALRFRLSDGAEWRTGMNAIPVFAVNTPAAFAEQLVAMAPNPQTGKPDPARVKDFFARHPESARAVQLTKAQPLASGFADSTFNSLDAFRFIDEAGHSTPVRWAMLPLQPFAAATTAAIGGNGNALFDGLIAAIHRGPLQWRLVVTIGRPGDATNDATVAWPSDREQVEVGILTIDHIESEATSPLRTLNFDPLILPSGIAASDDPLLSARSAAYSQSFTRRQRETPSAGAVTAAEVAP